MGTKQKNKMIYFDYAATTPVDPRVVKAMLPYFSEKFGNTMSVYSFGQEVKGVLEKSRKTVADFIKAKPKEIIFTASATESNNLALKGVALANKSRGKNIIISPIEHPCVLESVRWLEKQGFEITILPVDKYGLVDPEVLRKAIRENTILVSIIHASNEIGTIQPIEELGKIVSSFKLENENCAPYFHTDAAQSFGKIKIDINKMNIDLLTASSHKMYGPKGVACLFVREGTRIEPILHGGGHEFGLRSGTINLPAIVGFAKAVEIAEKEMEKEKERLTKLRDKLIKNVLNKIDDSYLNGHPTKRLPNNANFRFSFIEGEAMVLELDSLGIVVSSGSACSSPKLEPSHVLLAIGLKHQDAHGSIRISLGRWTKERDVDCLIKVLPGIIERLRDISPFKSIKQ